MANDRADKRLGAGAKQRHEANPVMVQTPLFFGVRPTGMSSFHNSGFFLMNSCISFARSTPGFDVLLDQVDGVGHVQLVEEQGEALLQLAALCPKAGLRQAPQSLFLKSPKALLRVL